MTDREAIETLQEEHDYAQLLSYVNSAIRKAISALEKQIPKEVNISIKGTTDYNTSAHCPSCHKLLSGIKPNYCSDCGQALYWNNMKKGGNKGI